MNLCGKEIGLNQPLFLIAGPCTAESQMLCEDVAGFLKKFCVDRGILYIFKASYDKANRTSHTSKRGLGLDAGLKILQNVQKNIGVPVLTDVHEKEDVLAVASVVDVLQTPAFLCRQTDFIQSVAACGKPVNIKKGQFLAPDDMQMVVEKARAANGGADNLMVCERGASFGYHNLVSDMRSLVMMRNTQCPVVFDATHSVQLPGAANGASGGNREFIAPWARAAVAVGIAGLFMETHPEPDKAWSDGANSFELAQMPKLIEHLLALDKLTKNFALTVENCENPR